MDSIKNIRWIIPFKKFIMVRAKFIEVAEYNNTTLARGSNIILL